MKKVILIAAFGFLAIMSQAQGRADNPGKAPKTIDQKVNGQLNRMNNSLQLSEEQQKALTPILKTKMVAMEREKEKIAAAKAEMERINAESDKQIKGILNEKQIMQYESEEFNRKSNVKQGKGGRGNAPANN